jgi:hypothetical protein
LIETAIPGDYEGSGLEVSIGVLFNALYRRGIVTSFGNGFASYIYGKTVRMRTEAEVD